MIDNLNTITRFETIWHRFYCDNCSGHHIFHAIIMPRLSIFGADAALSESNLGNEGEKMIRKRMMGFSKMIWIMIIVGTTLAALNLIVTLATEQDESTQLRLMISLILFGLVVLIFVKNFFINQSRYKKLFSREGERGMELLEAEYQAGGKTKDVVFGDKHLFIENESSVGFDIVNYQEIFWMHPYVYTTKILFIPILRIRNINVYLDAPERGRAQMVQINAKHLDHDGSLNEFFAKIKEKNPNILLGHDLEWQKMLARDKASLIRLAHNQSEVI